MCQSCHTAHVHFLFDWPTGLCDHAKRYALADIVTLVQDVLALPANSGGDELSLSGAGGRGGFTAPSPLEPSEA
jgi:hypothetical protein